MPLLRDVSKELNLLLDVFMSILVPHGCKGGYSTLRHHTHISGRKEKGRAKDMLQVNHYSFFKISFYFYLLFLYFLSFFFNRKTTEFLKTAPSGLLLMTH